ncbi:hypothetical protein KW807_01795 [Candidatus Parcubacteria bacterium]|nr:hypothetical protein [Candidatus Parcubacteria bacterium]
MHFEWAWVFIAAWVIFVMIRLLWKGERLKALREALWISSLMLILWSSQHFQWPAWVAFVTFSVFGCVVLVWIPYVLESRSKEKEFREKLSAFGFIRQGRSGADLSLLPRTWRRTNPHIYVCDAKGLLWVSTRELSQTDWEEVDFQMLMRKSNIFETRLKQ